MTLLTRPGNGPGKTPANPLQRSRGDRMIAGVCGGLAEWLGWDPTVVRLGYLVLTVLSAAFPGVLVYLLLWIIMPDETKPRRRTEWKR